MEWNCMHWHISYTNARIKEEDTKQLRKTETDEWSDRQKGLQSLRQNNHDILGTFLEY